MIHPLHKKICPDCEVPLIWSKDSVLDDDNTTLQKMTPVRGVFYEIDEIANLLSGLEKTVGISLSSIFFTAHKISIVQFFQGTLEGLSGRLAKKLASGLVFKQIADMSPNFGVGRSRIVDYRRGESIRSTVLNVWHELLFAADFAAVWSVIEGTGCRVSSERVDNRVNYLIESTQEPEVEHVGRLMPVTGVLMGEPDYPRCPTCGSPQSFQIFRWNRDEGTIKERDNGVRVVHQSMSPFDSIMFELETELGDEIRDTAIRIQADFVRDRISGGTYDRAGAPTGPPDQEPSTQYGRYLGLIRRRCMGNPLSIDIDNSKLEVVVRNPANQELVLGRTLGTYEAIEKKTGSISWREIHGTIEMRVIPTS